MTTRRVRSLSLLLFALGAAPSLAACGAPEEGNAEASSLAAPFPVASPQIRDVVIDREYVADVRAARYAEVRSRFRGTLESVEVDEGETVEAGRTLFTIGARVRQEELAVARAARAGAKAELEAAKLELQNTQLLADKNVVSAAELARARSKVKVLEARLAQAKAAAERAAVEVDRARIRAPFDGVIDRIPRKEGSAIAEDELLTTITDAREVFAYFAITEREYLELSRRRGEKPETVGLVLADGSTFAQRGEIDAVGAEVDADTGTLVYRARFANPDGLLKHGSSGKVVLSTTLHQALVVPQKSTFEVQGNVYVFALDGDNVARARKILVEKRLDDMFVIAGGLDTRDRFVLEGVQKLEDGVHVEVQEKAAASATPAVPRG